MSAGHHTKAWPRLRRRVLTRDRHQCQDCKRQGMGRVEVHHVKHLADGGSDDLDNLTTLCYDCHRARHASAGRRDITRGAWATLLYKGMVYNDTTYQKLGG